MGGWVGGAPRGCPRTARSRGGGWWPPRPRRCPRTPAFIVHKGNGERGKRDTTSTKKVRRSLLLWTFLPLEGFYFSATFFIEQARAHCRAETKERRYRHHQRQRRARLLARPFPARRLAPPQLCRERQRLPHLRCTISIADIRVKGPTPSRTQPSRFPSVCTVSEHVDRQELKARH